MHKTPKAHEVGSTAWYKAMAAKLKSCTSEMQLERYRRLSLSMPKIGTALNQYIEDLWERRCIMWRNKKLKSNPNKIPITPIVKYLDMDKLWKESESQMGIGNHLHFLYDTASKSSEFPKEGDPKQVYSTPEQKKAFNEIAYGPDKYYIAGEEVSKEEYSKQNPWPEKRHIFNDLRPILNDRENIGEDNKRTLNLYKGLESILVSKLSNKKDVTENAPTPAGQRYYNPEDWKESNRMFKKYYEDNFDAKGKPKTFEDKVYYIKKYNSFIQVKNRAGETLILSGLCICLEDTKTTLSRQRMTVSNFLDLSPIELDEKRLHMYSSFMYWRPWEVTGGGTWTVKCEKEYKSSYMKEAEQAPSIPYTSTHQINWPMF